MISRAHLAQLSVSILAFIMAVFVLMIVYGAHDFVTSYDLPYDHLYLEIPEQDFVLRNIETVWKPNAPPAYETYILFIQDYKELVATSSQNETLVIIKQDIQNQWLEVYDPSGFYHNYPLTSGEHFSLNDEGENEVIIFARDDGNLRYAQEQTLFIGREEHKVQGVVNEAHPLFTAMPINWYAFPMSLEGELELPGRYYMYSSDEGFYEALSDLLKNSFEYTLELRTESFPQEYLSNAVRNHLFLSGLIVAFIVTVTLLYYEMDAYYARMYLHRRLGATRKGLIKQIFLRNQLPWTITWSVIGAFLGTVFMLWLSPVTGRNIRLGWWRPLSIFALLYLGFIAMLSFVIFLLTRGFRERFQKEKI